MNLIPIPTAGATPEATLSSILDVVAIQSVILNQLLVDHLHLGTKMQAMRYCQKHPNPAFYKTIQALHHWTDDEFKAFNNQNQIFGDLETTEHQLINMTTANFELFVDCCTDESQPQIESLLVRLAAERKISEPKIRYVHQRLPILSAVAEVEAKKTNFGGIDSFYIDKLLEWTGKKSTQIIYNSDTAGRSVNDFNDAVCGRQDVAIFVVNGSMDVFGSYHHKQINAPPKSRWEAVTGDRDFFVFTCKNACNVPISRYFPADAGSSLILWPSRDTGNIFAVAGAYRIGQIESSVMRRDFLKTFRGVPECGASLFAGNGKERFMAHKILVLQLD